MIGMTPTEEFRARVLKHGSTETLLKIWNAIIEEMDKGPSKIQAGLVASREMIEAEIDRRRARARQEMGSVRLWRRWALYIQRRGGERRGR